MAIIPENEFIGKINAADANYDLGSARDVVSDGDGTGTPWKARLINDLWGFNQKLINVAGITPSGSPDTILASDYFDGLMTVVSRPTLTVSTMTAIVSVKPGQVFNVAERSAGKGGGAFWVSVVTGSTPDVDLPNLFDIVVGVADPLISFVLRKKERINVVEYGCLPGVGDCLAAFTRILADFANEGKEIYFPGAGTLKYAFSDRNILTSVQSGITITGAGFGSLLGLTGTHTTNKGLFYIPADGDPDGGTVDGADNVTIKDLNLDGSGATMTSGVSGGIRAFHGEGHIFSGIWAHEFTKQGILLQSVGAADVSYKVSDCYLFGQTGTGGQGLSIATTTTEASRIIVNNLHCYDNDPTGTGLGIDLSTGSAQISDVNCWNNGSGGMKTAGNDNQHLILNNADFSNNTNTGAQGFFTNGTFRLIEFNNVRCNNNAEQGIQLAQAGTFLGSNISCEGNGNIGFHQSGAADSIIDNLFCKSNANRGLLIGAGKCQIGKLRTESNDRVGGLVSTTGRVTIQNHLSIDDCLVSDANALFLQPAATTGTHDGAGNAAVLTDTTAAFDANELVGKTIKNTTDGSEAIVTANTATTITGVLSGGTDDDWDISDAYSISLGIYTIGNVVAVNTGAGGVTAAVSINSVVDSASITSIQKSGIANAISDSGINTSYFNSDGRCKLPRDRLGFYGNPPLVKQTISGSRGANAALADLLTKLATLGLIIDSTS